MELILSAATCTDASSACAALGPSVRMSSDVSAMASSSCGACRSLSVL